MGFLGQILPGPAGSGRTALAAIIFPYLRWVPLIAVLGLLASLLEGAGIGLLIPLVSLLLADHAQSSLPALFIHLTKPIDGMDRTSQLFAIAGMLSALVLAKGAVQAGNNALIARIDGGIGRGLRNSMAERTLGLEHEFFLRNQPPALIHVMSGDCWYASEAIRAVLTMIPAGTAVLVFAAILFWVDWRLTLVVALGATIIELLVFTAQRRQKTLGQKANEAAAGVTERTLAIAEAMRTVRLFGQEKRELARFENASEAMRRTASALQRFTGRVIPTVEAMMSLLFVAVLVMGYRLGVSLAAITAYLVLLARAQPYAVSFGRSRVEYASMHSALGRVSWLLGQQPAPRSIGGTRPVASISEAIQFDRVSYRYPDGRLALDGVSFSVKPGVATALIGRSGAGKTTIVNLLCRLVEPSSGEVGCGDSSLGEMSPEQWRSRIAVAGQDVELLDGTVEENIAYSVPSATRDAIIAAAKAARAHEFIEALPNGYDTQVTLHGLNLSGGQRQRIGLARALIRKPDLLILDEAVSAVDALSEREIVSIIRQRRGFKTALVISHRRSSLEACEEGVVLEEGRVTASGPLQTLAYLDATSDPDEV